MCNFSNTLILIAKRYQYFDPSKHHYEKHKIMSRTAYKEIEYKQCIASGVARRYVPRQWQFDDCISFPLHSGHLRQSTDPKIAADLRPSADGQPACLQPRQLRNGTDRRKDGQTEGRIALFQNATQGGGIISRPHSANGVIVLCVAENAESSCSIQQHLACVQPFIGEISLSSVFLRAYLLVKKSFLSLNSTLGVYFKPALYCTDLINAA